MKSKPISMFLLKSSSKGTTLTAEGILTIQDSARLKDLMLEAYAGGGDLSIDLGESESIDLSCLQVLCSANITYQKAGLCISITRLSEGVSESLQNMATGLEQCTLINSHRCLWAKGA